MPATINPLMLIRSSLAVLSLFVFVFSLPAYARQPDNKKQAEPKAKDSPVVKLPDGTFLWVGNSADGNGERVSLSPQELQKLLDQLDQLRKQLAAKKPTPPSGCAIRGRVEKRGEQLVVSLKLTCTFRTTISQSAVALGGRRGFLVGATLDGSKLPILDTTDDGFSLMVETVGDHTLTLDLEAPITSRGGKPELGFEIGLPRAAITTLLFDSPGQDVKRVNLTTRSIDPGQTVRPPEVRRIPALELKQLTSKPGQEAGYPLGPVDTLEVTWDPPVAAAQPADQVQSAELDVSVLLTQGVVETTAKIRLRGPAREWKLVAPSNADLSVDYVAGSDVGPTLPATITKPVDPNKPVWRIVLPVGSAGSDWVVTAVTRQLRPKPEDPAYRGPFSIGPFTTLDVLRQTGMVRVTAGANTHFTFKHGPDLRKAEPTGPAEDEVTTAFFRLTTGPTGATPVNTPLFTIEARAQHGAVKVKPTYRMTLTDAGWRVRAEIKVIPIRTEVESVVIEVPSDWRGLEALPPELVEGVQQGVSHDGFWATTAARFAGGLRVPVVVRLAMGHKQPFDLVLTATVAVDPGDTSGVVPLPRFPEASVSATFVSATVPEGFELRGETRDWDDEYAAWGTPMTPGTDAGGKATRAVTTMTAKAEAGFARVTLAWNPYHADLASDLRVDVTVGDRQIVIVQHIRLQSSTGLPRQLRFRGPVSAAAFKTVPTLDFVGPGEWGMTTTPDAKDVSVSVSFAVSQVRQSLSETTAYQVPVPILWPVGANRLEATVRIWSNYDRSRTITNQSSGWREMPVDLVPDRDMLPALSLVASNVESLLLETHPTADVGTVSIWVDRGFIQAWGAEDGTVSYRARFLIRRWLRPSLEIRIPGSLAGPNPEFFRDGQRVEAVPNTNTDDARGFRIPLPIARAGATTVVEVRYQLAVPRGRPGDLLYQPPLLSGVVFSGPVRWHALVPSGCTPLLVGGAQADFRWRLGSFGISPQATGSEESIEAWFACGEDSRGDLVAFDEGFTARQTIPTGIAVYQIPTIGMIFVCSVFAFVVVLLLWRLPKAIFGLGIAGVGAVAVVNALFFPHPAAQVLGACQPGIAAAAVVLALLSVTRWFHNRRLTRMPGFSRTPQDPSGHLMVLPSSARNRPNPVATPASDPVSPIEG